MKIGMICPYLIAPVGNVSVFLSLAEEFQNQGHEVDIYSYYFDKKACLPELTKNLKVYAVKRGAFPQSNLNFNSVQSRIMAAYDYYVNFKKIASLMNKKVDVLFVSEAGAYIPALIYKQKYNTPIYWSVFDPITLIDSKKKDSAVNKYSFLKFPLKVHSFIDKRNIRKVDYVLVPTKKMKQQFDSYYQIDSLAFSTAGIRQTAVRKNYTKIIEKRLKDKFNFIRDKKEVILFTNAHFQPHRRFEDIIMALNDLRKQGINNLKLIISGSNKFNRDYYESIEKLVKKLSLQDSVFIDSEFKSNNELTGYYQYCDIFLFVSVEQTWGLAPFEAMIQKKPVIISRGVGCAEVLENNVNAIVVNEKSPKDIAKELKKLINNPKLRNQIGENGSRFTLSNFSYRGLVRKLIKLFGMNKQ